MDEIIRILMSMGKTKEEALEFVGKEMPKGGVDNVASNVLKPITKKVAGDFPLIGSRITDPTQTGQYGRHNIQVLNTMDRYPLIRQSIEDQKLNWQKTLEFIREGGYTLSDLQKQNLNYNLGVLQRSKVVLKDIEKGLTSEGQNVEEIYQEFVRNKRFLGNEKTGLSSEGNEILEFIEETRGKGEDLTKTTKNQEQILKDQKAANDKRMKRLYEGRAYEGDVGTYRALGGYHLPKLHEAGIINLDPKIYEAIKAGRYHHGGAEFFAPDPNRVLQYHFGSKIFDDLDKAIEEAALKGGDIALKGPTGMIDFLKKNDYLPFKVNGPANAIDYLKPDELLERIKEIEASSEIIKKGNSPFFKTPDEIMNRVMVNANEKKLYLESFKRTHPEKYKLYEKKQSEEPFFALGDVGQSDIFSDLTDITYPKDKADLLQFPKKKKVKVKEEETVPVKPGQGKFTKAEYLIQRLENTLKDPNADPYVRKTFPGFIDELKANPDLAKDENVFKELGGDLPEDQQIVVYDDDTLDFFTQKEGPGNIKTLDKLLEDNPFLSREEGLNLLKMEPNDQVMELTKLKFLNKKKTDNAEGGIINLAKGGRINYKRGTGLTGVEKTKNIKSERGLNLFSMFMEPRMNFREPLNSPYKNIDDIPENALEILKSDPVFDFETFKNKFYFSDPDKTRIQEKLKGKDEPWGLTSTMTGDMLLNMQEFGKSEPIAEGLLTLKSPSDQDKAAVVLHEMRHEKMLTDWFMKSGAVPKWVQKYEKEGLPHYLDKDVMDNFKEYRKNQKEVSGEELYIRFLDQHYNDIAEKDDIAGSDYKPYFDKILSDFWTPHLKAYDSILTAEKYETSKPIIKKALAQ